MEDALTQARLVEFDEFPTGGVSTTLSRTEIAEAAARGEYPARLFLELDAAAGPATIAVDWDEPTLDRLLQTTDADDVELWFDADELSAIGYPDVEGHGMKERAALLAVAVAAAGGTAGSAFAAGGTAYKTVDGGALPGAPAAAFAQTDPGTPAQAFEHRDPAPNVQPQPAPAAGDTGGVTLPSPGETAGIAAGIALLISAAGFGAARTRNRQARPA